MYYDDGEVRVRESVEKDAIEMADLMRRSDIDEIWASNHLTPLEALTKGLDNSVFCLTVENGRPIAMFGVASEYLIASRAVVWLLASDDLVKIQKRFLRYSRTFIEIMLSRFPYLENYVDVRNEKSIKWLKLCGAILDEPEPYGVEQKMFRHFYFRRKSNV